MKSSHRSQLGLHSVQEWASHRWLSSERSTSNSPIGLSWQTWQRSSSLRWLGYVPQMLLWHSNVLEQWFLRSSRRNMKCTSWHHYLWNRYQNHRWWCSHCYVLRSSRFCYPCWTRCQQGFNHCRSRQWRLRIQWSRLKRSVECSIGRGLSLCHPTRTEYVCYLEWSVVWSSSLRAWSYTDSNTWHQCRKCPISHTELGSRRKCLSPSSHSRTHCLMC